MATPSRDELVIHPALRTAVNLDAPTGNDVLDLYFTPAFSGGAAANLGSNFEPIAGLGVGPLFLNQAHIGLNGIVNFPDTTPHEAMHQLTGIGDVAITNHIFFPNAGGPGGITVNNSRRMRTFTENLARTGPGGVRLLRPVP